MNKPAFPIGPERNVFGEPLAPCSADPLTGFFRTGRCLTGPEDIGRHVVCAEMTEAFLAFSKAHGNDLTTPRPELAFTGLVPGDRWCLVAERWLEAFVAGVAPRLVLQATHEAMLNYVPLDTLRLFALDVS